MPNIIHLKDYSDKYVQRTHTFIRAEATKSRLMGVVGVKLYFDAFILYFHLDFEEYGFDRFEVGLLEDDEQLTSSVMGGLGSGLIEIDRSEASYLIYEAIDVGERYGYGIPPEFFSYDDLIEETTENVLLLYSKICETIDSDEMLIHYFLMRTAGLDHVCRKMMLQEGDFDFEFFNEPSMLLKNEIVVYEESYICTSIIDYLDAYKMLITRIHTVDGRVIRCELIEELLMSAKEAAFQLSRKEHIILFYLPSSKSFRLTFEKPQMMKNNFDAGVLLTRLHDHNDHVKQPIYYLNDDLYASYFILDNQLVVTCFDESILSEIKKEMKVDYALEVMAELEAEQPILTHFINSGENDFFDFLGE